MAAPSVIPHQAVVGRWHHATSLLYDITIHPNQTYNLKMYEWNFKENHGPSSGNPIIKEITSCTDLSGTWCEIELSRWSLLLLSDEVRAYFSEEILAQKKPPIQLIELQDTVGHSYHFPSRELKVQYVKNLMAYLHPALECYCCPYAPWVSRELTHEDLELVILDGIYEEIHGQMGGLPSSEIVVPTSAIAEMQAAIANSSEKAVPFDRKCRLVERIERRLERQKTIHGLDDE